MRSRTDLPGSERDPVVTAKRNRRSAKRSLMAKVAALSGAATIAVFGGLWLQMALGQDPALGPKTVSVQKAKRPVIKKITVVRRTVPSTSSGSSSSYGTSSSSGSSYTAPAPAPVVTATS